MTRLCACLLAALVSFACTATGESLSVSSPDGRLAVHFALDGGAPTYSVTRADRVVIRPSRLGFEFREQPALAGGLEVASTARATQDETWEQPWGETRLVRFRPVE